MTETQNVPEHPAFRVKHPGSNVLEKVMITLTVFTFVELAISFLLEGGTLTLEIAGVILIVLALIKATLIAGFFMHLFYERKPLFIIFIAFVGPMLIALPIAFVALTV